MTCLPKSGPSLRREGHMSCLSLSGSSEAKERRNADRNAVSGPGNQRLQRAASHLQTSLGRQRSIYRQLLATQPCQIPVTRAVVFRGPALLDGKSLHESLARPLLDLDRSLDLSSAVVGGGRVHGLQREADQDNHPLFGPSRASTESIRELAQESTAGGLPFGKSCPQEGVG